MGNAPVLMQTDLPQSLFRRGKVRDSYDLGRELLIVATDRVSAFDVVLPSGIPRKGVILTQLAAFWFEKTAHLVPNHVVEVVNDIHLLNSYIPRGGCYVYPGYLARRSMIVVKAEVIPVECVVRGYLAGSAWAEYSRHGTVNGVALVSGLRESERLPRPLFTPTTKADVGHDLPLTFGRLENQVGGAMAAALREKSLAVYDFAETYARQRGILIADTKFEFGVAGGRLILVDELLTPDSSRFWGVDTYQVGRSQPSFDKQIVRDWLTGSGWNREPPGPELPAEISARTAQRYQEVYERLTGLTLEPE